MGLLLVVLVVFSFGRQMLVRSANILSAHSLTP